MIASALGMPNLMPAACRPISLFVKLLENMTSHCSALGLFLRFRPVVCMYDCSSVQSLRSEFFSFLLASYGRRLHWTTLAVAKFWPGFACCLKCTKFGQLIIRRVIKMVATRCQILRLKCTKFNFGWSSAPDTGRKSHSAP